MVGSAAASSFKMLLTYRPFLLELRHPFRLAMSSRTHTNAVLTEIRLGDCIGYGEAAMPPYYGENCDTACAFLASAAHILVNRAATLEAIQEIMLEVDAIAPGNHAAKAAIDIALHDLWGKTVGKPLWQLLETDPAFMPRTSFTLGIDTPEILRKKLSEATGFQIIKIKLGSADDRQIVRTIREVSDLPIYADANQGWHDRHAALDLIHWLAEQNVVLIEQPSPKDDLDSAAWLSERSPIPIIADESFQRLSDLDRVANCFHGVNIKLMKCTGLAEGMRIASAARDRGLKLMIGCMTETSCGILAAAALAPRCDFADIDGCWLIRNNPFELPKLEDGKVALNHAPGLGLVYR
jgi:L-alanine-DL-glutamate epimerase-like enolase superfamily enzyme